MPTYIAGRAKRPSTCRVTFTNWNKTVECPPHTNLRDLALQHDIPLYNGLAKFTNCEGFGLCGTCTVEVRPQSAVSAKGAKENFRFVQLRGNLRLACQVEVQGDVEVTKHRGVYGTKGRKADASKEEVARLYLDEAKTVAGIAKHLGMTVPRVVVALQHAGVELRRPGSAA